jgi:putative membrane protein
MILLKWVLSAVCFLLLAKWVPGITVDGWLTAFFAAFVFGVVNAFVRPVVQLLTFPITLLTLGLFTLVINAGLFWLVSILVPGFVVQNFVSAFIGAILLALLTTVAHWVEKLIEGKKKGA